MFKKDHILLGMLYGILIPAIGYGITVFGFKQKGVPLMPELLENIMLLLIAANGILLRFVLVNKKMEKTGRGILIVTMIMLIIWVAKFQ
jgi:hypothetical protein